MLGRRYYDAAMVLDMPNAEYHAHPGISNSGLTRIDQSAAHYHDGSFGDPTRAMEIGTAIHTAILEPERYKSEYMLLPEVKARTATEYKNAVKERGSEFVLVGAEVARVEGMHSAVYASPYISKRLSVPAWKEISVFAIDPETGVLCKCRFDFLSHDFEAIDVKKTQDARKDAFSKTITSYRYHVQAAFYSDVFFWCTGQQLKSFEFLAIEEKASHGKKMYRAISNAVELGRSLYRENLNTYAECKESGVWPNYDCEETEDIDVMYWAYNKFEEENGVEITYD